MQYCHLLLVIRVTMVIRNVGQASIVGGV